MPTAPFLPPQVGTPKEYCLVVDLDETLVHYTEEENAYMVRPGVAEFLKELSPIYELVLFTASVQEYADWIMGGIDPNNYFVHRLYRNHCTQKDGMYMKDLSLLGRDVKKTIIIDNLFESFYL